MDTLFINIIKMSISASAAILIVFFFRFFLRKLPKFFLCFLWLTVLIKLLVPFSVKGIYHFIPLPSIQHNMDFEERKEDINHNTFFSDSNFSALLQGQTENKMEIHDNVSIMEETGSSYIFNGLFCLWIAGFCVMMIHSLKTYTYIFKLKKNSQKDERYSNVYRNETLIMPFAAGIFKPTVYMPIGLEKEEYELIICHEQMHIKRMDYLLKFIFYIALALHWFNPLVWAAFSAMEKDMEMACDEAVIGALGPEKKKDYALSLLHFSCKVERRISVLSFGRNHVEGRINNVLNYKKKSFSYLLIGFVMVVFTACTAVSEPGDTEEEVSETAVVNSKTEYTIMLTTEMPEGNKPAYFDVLVTDEENLKEILELDGSLWTYKQNFIDGEPVVESLSLLSLDDFVYVARSTYSIYVDEHLPELHNLDTLENQNLDTYTKNNEHIYISSDDGYRLITTFDNILEKNPYLISNWGFINGDEENYEAPFYTNEDDELFIRFYAVKENKPVYFSLSYISNDGQYLYLNEEMVFASKGFKRN